LCKPPRLAWGAAAAHIDAMQMAVILAALAAFATPADDAGAFVDGLYAYYATPEPGPRDDADIFTPDIVALFARVDALSGPDEVGREGDELCQCQDWENLRLVERVVHPSGDGLAEVDLRFENFGEAHSAHLSLRRTPDGWRVADIADVSDGRSLVAMLRADVAEAERQRGQR
jgi:hypothetical protein